MASIDNLLLIIGMPRSGTTWLHARLRAHSRIVCALNRVKEVHYFDHLYGHAILEKDNRPRPPDRNNAARFAAFHRRIDKIDQELVKTDESERTKLTAERRRLQDFVTHFGSSDEWYAQLFPAKDGDWCLDSTPRYHRLPDDAFRHMMAIADRKLFVLLLRNPYDRTISGLQHRIDIHGLNWAEMCEAEQISVAREVANLADVGATIKRISEIVPDEILRLLYFDSVIANPEKLVRYTVTAAGLDFEPACMAKSENPPNPSVKQEFSNAVKSAIFESSRSIANDLKSREIPVPKVWDDPPIGLM